MSQTRAQLVKGLSNTSASDDAVTVDSSGRVLVATTTSNANAGADDLQIGDRTAATERGITIGSTAGGGIRFADAGSTNAGIVEYQHSSNNMRFYTDATERVQITGNGTIKLISSGGIDFSGIQTNASGMTSETLDSYEEGTWTPSTSNFTHTTGSARYTKIGRKVHIFGALIRNQSSAPTTAVLEITGLPFNRSTSQTSFDGTFWLDNGGPSSGDNVGGVTYIYTTTQIIFAAATSPGQQATNRYVRGNDLNNTRGIQFSCTYYTD